RKVAVYLAGYAVKVESSHLMTVRRHRNQQKPFGITGRARFGGKIYLTAVHRTPRRSAATPASTKGTPGIHKAARACLLARLRPSNARMSAANYRLNPLTCMPQWSRFESIGKDSKHESIKKLTNPTSLRRMPWLIAAAFVSVLVMSHLPAAIANTQANRLR